MTLCVNRHRERYCPQKDGTFQGPCSQTVLSTTRVDVLGTDYVSIASPIRIAGALNGNADNLGSLDLDFKLNSGFFATPSIDGFIASAFAWWSSPAGFKEHQYAGTTGLIKEMPADDTLAQFLYDLTEVEFSLTVSRAGTQYHGEGRLDHTGGVYSFVKQVDTSSALSDSVTLLWGLDKILHVAGGSEVPTIEFGQACFRIFQYLHVDLFQPGSVTVDGQLFFGLSEEYSGTNHGILTGNSMVYDATKWTSVTLTWDFAYYKYTKSSYSCCCGCAGCSGPIVTIPTGDCVPICVQSSYVDLASSGTVGQVIVTGGPLKCGGFYNLACGATACVGCITQKQIDAGGYQGPYTLKVATGKTCWQGGQFLYEVLTGQFMVSVKAICAVEPPPSSGPGTDVLYWKEGYHIVGDTGQILEISRRWHPDMSFDFSDGIDTAARNPCLSHPRHGPPLGVVYELGQGKERAIFRRESYDYGATWSQDPGNGLAIRSGVNGVSYPREVWNDRTGERLLLYNDRSEKDSDGNATGRGAIKCDVFGPEIDNGTARLKKGPTFDVLGKDDAGNIIYSDDSGFGAIFIGTEGALDVVVEIGGRRKVYRSYDDGRSWREDT